ncbi:hypothetical protein L3X38_024584 [Prunus dulcis]|uniref:Uncharacterized protein n=1 Tax=Prunus dulcis TaxID=3755 RepID=A0AAD4W0X8_PRUDU|nr:hypothetical protein L3X38_024584 [Prunus dulcis]
MYGICGRARGQEDGVIISCKEIEGIQVYKKLDWDAFVASRLSKEFEVLHNEQSEKREKCQYNHRLSRKGYISLED